MSSELLAEYPKAVPTPRKQNTACDACRARKVKCHRVPDQGKCQHCFSKNYPCTNFVQQATTEKKRTGAAIAKKSKGSAHISTRYIPRPQPPNEHLSDPSPPRSISPGTAKIHSIASPSPLTPSPSLSHSAIPLTPHGFYPRFNANTPTHDVLLYMFAPPNCENDAFIANRTYTDWDIDGSSSLESSSFRTEFALDLVEVFFQIVHTRLPLLNPAQFRARLGLQPNLASPESNKPLHPALVATILAWGSKFSEHALLATDRQQHGSQSRLARVLIDRARELAEALKVHRIASEEHIIISLLIEPLQNQRRGDPSGFPGFWLMSATKHLMDLRINHKVVTSQIQDPELRGTMIFAWWMAVICDAYASMYYRRRPLIHDEDYDIDFYTAEPVAKYAVHANASSSREQLESLGYYRAAHALARMCRRMARQLWRPVVYAEGIPFEILSASVSALMQWRDEYLNVVGVPQNHFDKNWDFVSAVSSCASDASYHVMWVILFTAVDEFGIREENELQSMKIPSTPPPNSPSDTQIENAKRRLNDEALHSALRISGLAGVLTLNGYLKLDPAVMHVSCIHAGNFLARLGRPEVSNCIDGLDQYSYSYEESAFHAAEMREVYGRVLSGADWDLKHMASVASRLNFSGKMEDGMLVDTLNEGPHNNLG